MGSRKGQQEAPELGAMVRRMVRALVRRAAAGDTEALEQLAALELELPTATSCALAMMNTPRAGLSAAYSFTELAGVLGTSRQAARQRTTRLDVDDKAAAFYSDGASQSLSWSVAL